MNLASGKRRTPRLEASSTSASRASSGGTPSAAGEALQRLPAIVPRFWIWTAPISRAAALRRRTPAAVRRGRSRSRSSPRRSGFRRLRGAGPASSCSREMSSRSPGKAASFAPTIRSVPPARTRKPGAEPVKARQAWRGGRTRRTRRIRLYANDRAAPAPCQAALWGSGHLNRSRDLMLEASSSRSRLFLQNLMRSDAERLLEVAAEMDESAEAVRRHAAGRARVRGRFPPRRPWRAYRAGCRPLTLRK